MNRSPIVEVKVDFQRTKPAGPAPCVCGRFCANASRPRPADDDELHELARWEAEGGAPPGSRH